MSKYFRIGLLQILNIVAFVAMIVVNGLADFIPINGQTTGEISGKYPNEFVPAGITFSIWAVIYSLLALFTFYQGSTLFEYEKRFVDQKERIVDVVGYRFIISCLLNILWIFAWHYEWLLVSVLIMLGLLLTLISIFLRLHRSGVYGNVRKRWFVYAPFSVYLGWISIATIANITAYLVSIGWNGGNIDPSSWAAVMIAAGALLALLMLVQRRNYFYALTVVWALTGILIRQRSQSTYLTVVSVAALSAGIILLLLIAWLLLRERAPAKIAENKNVS